MTAPAHVEARPGGGAGEVPCFPCNPHRDPVIWMQDTSVSPFHPEEAPPVPITKGCAPDRSRLA